jgi:hypothetical protein
MVGSKVLGKGRGWSDVASPLDGPNFYKRAGPEGWEEVAEEGPDFALFGPVAVAPQKAEGSRSEPDREGAFDPYTSQCDLRRNGGLTEVAECGRRAFLSSPEDKLQLPIELRILAFLRKPGGVYQDSPQNPLLLNGPRFPERAVHDKL